MKEPSPEKSCKSFAELISAYLDGQLTDPQTAAVEGHLKDCPECARRLDQYRLINNLVNAEKVNCPVDLTSTVMAGLEREQLLTGLDDLAKPPASFRTWLLRTAAAAAMIGLVVYAGSLVIHFTGSSAKLPEPYGAAPAMSSRNALARVDADRANTSARPLNRTRLAAREVRTREAPRALRENLAVADRKVGAPAQAPE